MQTVLHFCGVIRTVGDNRAAERGQTESERPLKAGEHLQVKILKSL